MTQLLNTINKRDLQDVYAFLKQINHDLSRVEAICPATLYNDTDGNAVVELEVFCGESYPYYFTLPQTIFEKYGNEFFEQELQFLEVDADWNDALKVILTSESPVITWYEEYADRRDKTNCSNYLATQFFKDLTSELLLA
jgi:uncharacterized protein (DUF1330 family)